MARRNRIILLLLILNISQFVYIGFISIQNNSAKNNEANLSTSVLESQNNSEILTDDEINELVEKILTTVSFEDHFESNPSNQIQHNEDFILLINQGVNCVPILIEKLDQIERDNYDSFKLAYLLSVVTNTHFEYSSSKAYLYLLAEESLNSDIYDVKKKVNTSHGPSCLEERLLRESIFSLSSMKEYMLYGNKDITVPYHSVFALAQGSNTYLEDELFMKIDDIKLQLNKILEDSQ